MSDAAKLFWGSAVRHLLTILCTALIAHGYVSQSGAQAYIEELTGLALNLAVLAWAQRVQYWHIIKAIVARALPSSTTGPEVDKKVESLRALGQLPSAFTDPKGTPTWIR